MTKYQYRKRNPVIISFRIIGKLVVCLSLLLAGATPALANQQAPSGAGGVLNLLFLGLIAYFLVRAFRRRSGDNDDTKKGKWTDKRPDEKSQGRVIRPMDKHEAAKQMWGHLSSDKGSGTEANGMVPQASGAETDVFDQAEFLEGAKLFFSRFQQARDSREFDELKPFLSDDVYADATGGVEKNSVETRTEIMLLNARLMEVKSESGRTYATVFYDGQIRKAETGDQPEHIRAVWEFSRNETVANGLWILEKINIVDQ